MSVYEGEVWLTADIGVGRDATPGDGHLQLEVNLQACNDQSCAPPQKLILSIPVVVGPAGAN